MAKPTLADLTAFSAVASHRSFRRAADALGVLPSSLSHAMRGLEQDLGVRLLHRTTRSVAPTEAGQKLLNRLGPVLRELDDTLDSVAEDAGQPRGNLRINASASAISQLLRTIVPRYLLRYPTMSLDLVADGELIDIIEQGFDAGIRLGEALIPDMIAVPIGDDIRFLAVAAPAYLENRSPLTVPADLQQHQCIRQRLPSGKRYRWEFSKRDQEVVVDVPGPLTLDNVALMVEAALNGLGIAYVPETAVQDYLQNGLIVTVLEDWCPAIPGLFLYYSGRRHVPAGLRAFIDLIKTEGH